MVDLTGQFYAPTYKRRAKGLVKAGRAQWSDDKQSKICLLVSPAHIFGEDNEVFDKYDNDGNIITDSNLGSGSDLELDSKELSEMPEGSVSVEYIAAQLEKIRADSAYIIEALKQVKEITSHPPSINAGDVASQARAEAIGNIVKSREQTNQDLIAIYDKIYEDLRPEAVSNRGNKLAVLEKLSAMWAINPVELSDHIEAIFKEAMR